MEFQVLSALLADWYYYGRISPENKERIKQEAFRVGAADPEGCNTCPNFWNNIMHNMINYLSENEVTIMKEQSKFIFAEGTGSMRIPFSSTQLISEGETTKSLINIRDPQNEAFVQAVLDKFPELSEVILLNPEYIEPNVDAVTATTASTSQASTTSAAPAKRGPKAKATAPANTTPDATTASTSQAANTTTEGSEGAEGEKGSANQTGEGSES